MLTEIQSFLEHLRLVEEKGFKLSHTYVGAVRVGDYLLYEKMEDNPSIQGAQVSVMHCGRVLATGGEQGSGPKPDQHWIAVEGDTQIRRYGGGYYVLTLTAPRETPAAS